MISKIMPFISWSFVPGATSLARIIESIVEIVMPFPFITLDMVANIIEQVFYFWQGECRVNPLGEPDFGVDV